MRAHALTVLALCSFFVSLSIFYFLVLISENKKKFAPLALETRREITSLREMHLLVEFTSTTGAKTTAGLLGVKSVEAPQLIFKE